MLLYSQIAGSLGKYFNIVVFYISLSVNCLYLQQVVDVQFFFYTGTGDMTILLNM